MSLDDNDEPATPDAASFDEDAIIDENSEQEPASYVPRRGLAGERRFPRQLWLISYSDFMTILMIFFLAMYGYTYLAKASLLKSLPEKYGGADFGARVDEMQRKLGKQLTVQNDVDKIVLQLSDKILFDSGSASLNAGARPTLEELAKSIKLIEGEVIVSGHTDDIPMVGKRFKSNWELSAARAFSVIEGLTQAGVPPGRLAAWGFGENRPIVSNTSAANRAENRRIEVVILKKKQKN